MKTIINYLPEPREKILPEVGEVFYIGTVGTALMRIRDDEGERALDKLRNEPHDKEVFYAVALANGEIRSVSRQADTKRLVPEGGHVTFRPLQQ